MYDEPGGVDDRLLYELIVHPKAAMRYAIEIYILLDCVALKLHNLIFA